MIQRLRQLVERFGAKRFVRDTVIMQVAAVVQAGTYLVTSVLTARLLGDHEMGRWSTSLELYMFVYFLMNMGLARAATSLYSDAVGRQDAGRAIDAVAALLKLGGIMVALILAFGFLGAPALAERLYDDREVGQFSAILCFGSIAEVLRAMTMAVLTGSRQMKRYATFDIIGNVLRVGLIGGALLWRPEVETVVWAYVLHAVVVVGLTFDAYGRARRGDPKLAPPAWGDVLAAVPRAPLRQFFGMAYMLAISKSIHGVVTRVGILVIPAMGALQEMGTGMSEAANYKVGYVLNLVLQYAVGAIPNTLLPTLGLKMGSDDIPIQELGGLLRKVALTSGGITAGLTVLSVPFMWLVTTYAYGPGYDTAFQYYCLLAIGNLFIGFGVVTDPFYIYAGRLKHSIVQNLVYGLICLVVMATAAQRFGPMGVAGAIGVCRGLVLLHLVYIWIYYRTHREQRAAR